MGRYFDCPPKCGMFVRGHELVMCDGKLLHSHAHYENAAQSSTAAAPLKKGITLLDNDDEQPAQKDEELAAAYNAQWKRSLEERQEVASDVIHVREKIAQ